MKWEGKTIEILSLTIWTTCIRYTNEFNLESIEEFNQYLQAGPAVEYLIHSYPEFVAIDSLPLTTLDEKVSSDLFIFTKSSSPKTLRLSGLLGWTMMKNIRFIVLCILFMKRNLFRCN